MYYQDPRFSQRAWLPAPDGHDEQWRELIRQPENHWFAVPGPERNPIGQCSDGTGSAVSANEYGGEEVDAAIYGRDSEIERKDLAINELDMAIPEMPAPHLNESLMEEPRILGVMSRMMTLIERISEAVRRNGVGKLSLEVTISAEEIYPYDNQKTEHSSLPFPRAVSALQVILQAKRCDGIQRC